MERLLFILLALLLLASLASAKTSRTYYDEALMGRVRAQLEKFDWAKAQAEQSRQACDWLVAKSDQELWDFVPPPEQLRAINVCIAHDCPVCGDAITRQAGHYPWIMRRDRPFKVECPVCHGIFPSNDFQPWNTEGLQGKPDDTPGYVDKGLGWLDRKDGRRYYFVPYYIFWQRWSSDILGGLGNLAQAYLLTGDPVYAHKGAVLLCKIASEYKRLDYPTQGYHEGRFGVGGRISDYIWSTGNDSVLGRAADAFWPAFTADPELAKFLAAHGISDPRQTLEQELLRTMIEDIMAGRVAGNMGMHQRTLCELAIVFDNQDPSRGPTTADMRKWLMSGPGRVEDLLWNGFWREGLGGESSPGYASGWCTAFYDVAALLPRLGEDIWSNPKLKKMADIGLDLTIAERFCPDIGDCGSLKGTPKVGWTPELQGPAFMHYHDPRHAQALAIMGAPSRSLFEELFDEQLVADTVKRVGRDLHFASRNLGGYGVALLERGSGDNARGLSLYYGDASGGHGHYDRLNIELFAFGRPVLPEDGYPTPFTRPDYYEWRRADTCRHYCVQVDEEPQRSLQAGQLQNFAVAPELQVVEAAAEASYGSKVSLYRRTAALVDLSPDRSYLVDIFRVRGGGQHDWCFHGPPFPEFKLSGATLGPVQTKGTLAGEDVAYGAKPPEISLAGDLGVGLQSAQGVLTGDHYSKLGPQGWAPHASGLCTTKVGAEVTATLPQPFPAGPCKLLVQVWDYNNGVNEVEFVLGGRTVPLRIEPAGVNNYLWLNVSADLPQPATTVTLRAKTVGQTWALINRLVLTKNLALTEPGGDVRLASSGYQGFWDVQRARPAGLWSATFRKPDEDLSLTMTMPAGCTQEIISCLGEPELVPGSPKTVQYVLGRNRAAGTAPLLSKYVAVVEPHKGPAQVTSAELLTSADAAPESVGLRVTRQGATDFIHSALDAARETIWQGVGKPFTVQGEYALVTVDAEGVQRACLVNGTYLQYGDIVLQAAPPPTGKIVSVDHKANTVTLDQPLPNPEAYHNAVLQVNNELHRTSYMVQKTETRGQRTIVYLGDVLCIVGMGAVAEFDAKEPVLVADREFASYGRTEHDRHAGRWIYNEDKSRCFRLAAITSGKRLKLEGVTGDLSAIFTDADGDGRRLYWISDLGPGDTWRLPTATWIKRQGPGLYEAQAQTRVTLTLPKGN